MHSARKRSRRTREWQSDAEYIKDQDTYSTWSTVNKLWGDACATKFIDYGELLGDKLFHDDKVADFGGNDGWASFCFYNRHKIKPLVVDCEPKRLEYADKVYHLPTYQAFIEDMKELGDKSIDWGFCSHTLEHTRDTAKALREMARVIKRGCCFILPIEDGRHAKENHAHAIHFTSMSGWVNMLRENGWNIEIQVWPHEHECHIVAEPSC